jgi:hypothetical protein
LSVQWHSIKSAEWWQRNFGLEFAVEFNPNENQAILKLADGQWLHLVETEGPFNNQFKDISGYEKFRLTFEVREIEVIYLTETIAKELTLLYLQKK